MTDIKADDGMAAYDNRLAVIDTRLVVIMVMVGGLYAISLPALLLVLRLAYRFSAVG